MINDRRLCCEVVLELLGVNTIWAGGVWDCIMELTEVDGCELVAQDIPMLQPWPNIAGPMSRDLNAQNCMRVTQRGVWHCVLTLYLLSCVRRAPAYATNNKQYFINQILADNSVNWSVLQSKWMDWQRKGKREKKSCAWVLLTLEKSTLWTPSV